MNEMLLINKAVCLSLMHSASCSYLIVIEVADTETGVGNVGDCGRLSQPSWLLGAL